MFEAGAINFALRLYCAAMPTIAQRRAALERRLIHPPPPEEITVFLVTIIKKTVEIERGKPLPSYHLEAHIETSAEALRIQLRQKLEGDHRLQGLRAFVLQVKPDGTPAILAEVAKGADLDQVPADPMNR